MLFLGANGLQALAQRRRQHCLDFRRDQSDAIEILEVNAIAEAEAGELHRHDIDHGSKQDPFSGTSWRRKTRDRFRVIRTHSFADKDQVDCALRLRLALIDEHVDACRMPILESVRLRRFGDSLKIAAIDGDVDVARGTRRQRIAGVHVEEYRHPTDNTILDPRVAKRASHSRDHVEQLFHVVIVRGDTEHSWSIMQRPRTQRQAP